MRKDISLTQERKKKKKKMEALETAGR